MLRSINRPSLEALWKSFGPDLCPAVTKWTEGEGGEGGEGAMPVAVTFLKIETVHARVLH